MRIADERKVEIMDEIPETCVHRGKHYHGCDGCWYVECNKRGKDLPSEECDCGVCASYDSVKEGGDGQG